MTWSHLLCLSLCLLLSLHVNAQDSIDMTGSTFPSMIPSSGMTSVSIKYTASQNDVIVVDILSTPSNSWFGKGTANVAAGSGIAPMTITIQNTPANGNNYIFNVYIVKTSDYNADPTNAYTHALSPIKTQAVTVGTSSTPTGATTPTTTPSTYNYGTVLSQSILFYEAQRSGRLINNRIPFRGDSALNDKGSFNEDLTGGYYDAGDHVKFNFPQAWSITTLSWGVLAYKQGYVALGEYQHVLDAIKWGTDYLLKCHPDVNSHQLVAQVGDGNIDHAYWGRPEQMTMQRPVSYINDAVPGSDLAAEVAAAFAAASIVFKDSNPTYSATLIAHARTLYTFATTKLGKYSDSIPTSQLATPNPFYVSTDYKDELVWSAIWMYKATGEASFLTDAKTNYVNFQIQYQTFAFSWDLKSPGSSMLLAQILANTGDPIYTQAINSVLAFIKSYSVGGSVPRTPKGLPVILQWGSNRFATAAAWIALVYADSGLASQQDATNAINMATGIINYVLGDSGRSLVVGYGNNPPTHEHHRAASCPNMPAPCGQDQFNTPNSNPQILYGALVGGPKTANDDNSYSDLRNDFTSNEVTLDYNAGFQNALLRLSMMNPSTPTSSGQTTTTPTNPATSTPTQPTPATTQPTAAPPATTRPPTTGPTNGQVTTAPTNPQGPTSPTSAPTQAQDPTTPSGATNAPTPFPTPSPSMSSSTGGLRNSAHGLTASYMMIVSVVTMIWMMVH